MIPIYLKEKTIEALKTGQIILKAKTLKKRSIDDLLMYNIARKKRILNASQKYFYGFKESGLKIKMSKDKEIDYMSVLDGLTPEEQTFFILYNSVNYVDERFGVSPYLNEDISYMLAYLSVEEYNAYGSFLEKQEHKEIIEDAGYDKIKNKFDNTIGLFKFTSHREYALLHSKAIRIRNKDSMRRANAELVKLMCGDDVEIKQEVMKNAIDIMRYSTNEKSRLEALKLLGNWYGIEKKDTDITLHTILEGVNVGEILQNRIETEDEE